jgi:crotonobetainyl-CoA:carnitine CoA-transferase CaiB-like acyl-CoA transferase
MDRQALQGIRVVDLTQIWSGPFATQLLADLGAEVVKVEPIYRLDPDRGMAWPAVGATLAGDRPYNRSGSFNEHNRNKLAITLDLKKPAGVELFKRLVARSDVVIDNFSAGVMARLGLGYDDLRAVKPDIIVLSMPAFGNSGPEKGYIGYGPVQEQLSGVTSITGYQDGPPLETGFYYGDPSAGVQAAGAIMVALWARRRTGQGQFVDLSQRETLVGFLGEMLLDYQMNDRTWAPRGNRDDSIAPQGVYPCRGDDRWIAISCRDDDEWRRLCDAIGRPELADDARFGDVVSRHRHHDQLDAIVSDWTRSHDHLELTDRLQRQGIAGTAVLDHRELLENQHFRARGYFETVTHPEAGTHDYHGMTWKLSGTPGRIRFPAPLFGQHNQPVLRDLLGLSDEEIAELERTVVISSEPKVPTPDD